MEGEYLLHGHGDVGNGNRVPKHGCYGDSATPGRVDLCHPHGLIHTHRLYGQLCPNLAAEAVSGYRVSGIGISYCSEQLTRGDWPRGKDHHDVVCYDKRRTWVHEGASDWCTCLEGAEEVDVHHDRGNHLDAAEPLRGEAESCLTRPIVWGCVALRLGYDVENTGEAAVGNSSDHHTRGAAVDIPCFVSHLHQNQHAWLVQPNPLAQQDARHTSGHRELGGVGCAGFNPT